LRTFVKRILTRISPVVKQNIEALIYGLVGSGNHPAFLSPGSRNALVLAALSEIKNIRCESVVDERSAAFKALGAAKATSKTAILSCTSGTAALNYYPAMAEAFYARVPLIVLTADRPPNRIDQWDGQAIRQENVFANHVRGSYSTKDLSSVEDFLHLGKQVRAQMSATIPGPVHINIPIEEPFYKYLAESFTPSYTSSDEEHSPRIHVDFRILAGAMGFMTNDRVMVIHGMCYPGSVQVNHAEGAVVLNDVVSQHAGNVNHWEILTQSPLSNEDIQALIPDVLITTGTSFVNRKIKQWIRENPPRRHIHLSRYPEIGNPFDTQVEVLNPDELRGKSMQEGFSSKAYLELWREKSAKAKHHFDEVNKGNLEEMACKTLLTHLSPSIHVLHVANSMPIRWIGMLKNADSELKIEGNRGTSGIDGSISTAVGYALYSDKIQVVLTGDLTFLYDSNALMHIDSSLALKIVVLNNGGGKIFDRIEGPQHMGEAKKFQTTEHAYSCQHLSMHFGIPYTQLQSMDSLTLEIKKFLNDDGAGVLEVLL
jgi:2-succinyl-5-enolpyruvyl-6-hydroxy-3-cyclohexene-1-carboxylate synthase